MNTKESRAMSNEQVARETCIPDDCEIVEAIVPRGLVETGEKLDLSTLADVRRLLTLMQVHGRLMLKTVGTEPKIEQSESQSLVLADEFHDHRYRSPQWVSLSDALYRANRFGSHWCEIDGERWFVQRNGQSWRDRGFGRWLVRYASGGQVAANSWEDVLGYVRPLGADVTMRTEQSGVMVFLDDEGNWSATVTELPRGT
jgi:hypothetical protein